MSDRGIRDRRRLREAVELATIRITEMEHLLRRSGHSGDELRSLRNIKTALVKSFAKLELTHDESEQELPEDELTHLEQLASDLDNNKGQGRRHSDPISINYNLNRVREISEFSVTADKFYSITSRLVAILDGSRRWP